MRFSNFEVVLPLVAVIAISLSGLSNGQDLGSNIEKQLILVESDLDSIGKLATKCSTGLINLFPSNMFYKMKVFAQEL